MKPKADDQKIDNTIKIIRCFLIPATKEIINLFRVKENLSHREILEILRPKYSNIGITLSRLQIHHIIKKEWHNGNWYYELNTELIQKITQIINELGSV